MALTRSFRETVVQRVRTDPGFRAALVEEAVQNIIDGDVETALGQLRDVVNATMGFDALAAATHLPKTSVMRMLGASGNPRADNLGSILKALRTHTGVHIVARAEYVGEPEVA
jgi:DNA-binding phage protein